MKTAQQRKAATEFVKKWNGKRKELGQDEQFWTSLLRDVYGVKKPEEVIDFKVSIPSLNESTKFLDGYIIPSKTLIEQKAWGKDLDKEYPQSDGTMKTPFQQARRYSERLPRSQKPNWIIVCNFEEFRLHDMEHPQLPPTVIKLSELPDNPAILDFLVDENISGPDILTEISISAADIIGEIYEALLEQYKDPTSPHTLESLNILCVRLVFLLYAQSAGLLDGYNAFNAYLAQSTNLRKALKELFEVLDTPYDQRDPYIDDDPILASMPYINGGLFAKEDIEIPAFTPEIKSLLMKKAMEMDFSQISPTIFGAIFESCLDPERRRSGGMHYTSLKNIDKVIGPLFLNDLKSELNRIKETKGNYRKNPDGSRTWINQEKLLREFQDKLASIIVFDPAAGSGNFLTESYIQLRRLENEVIEILNKGNIALDVGGQIKVSLNQFYGIEINDFAVAVAKTALWIAESQMLEETREILQQEDVEFFPLKSYSNIIEGNALRMDWEELVEKDRLSYIIGNPPFVGTKYQSPEQKEERNLIFNKRGGELDYVACWFKKAADFIKGTSIRCCFVATNSITQGQQPVPLWEPLFKSGIVINFAYKSFVWDSESTDKAHVHCVIIGFSRQKTEKRKINDGKEWKEVQNINAYLMDGPNIFVKRAKKPLSSVPYATLGFKPADNGYLLLTDEEKQTLIHKEPGSEKWIRPFIQAQNYISGKKRWCLWLEEMSPSELNQFSAIKERVKACKEWRESQVKTGDAYKLRFQPALMRPNKKFKKGPFIVLPLVTSERRKYIPIGYESGEAIPGNKVSVLFDANPYIFGVLISSVHMSWMRAFAGRLKSDYSYLVDLVYNTFPWPRPTPAQKNKIEKTAQDILEARNLYPNASLADLYDETTMPPVLRKAHEANDKAVMEAYGFKKDLSEPEIVAELMRLYKSELF